MFAHYKNSDSNFSSFNLERMRDRVVFRSAMSNRQPYFHDFAHAQRFFVVLACPVSNSEDDP